jgi:DNA-directed RNA polymerase specialized sigma24 family protein
MASGVVVASPTREARLMLFRPQIQRHILAMVRDQTEAEELTQEAYARALERLGQLRDPQAGLAWLYRIATTVTLDRIRQRRPSTVPLDTVATTSGEAEQAAARERPPSLLEGALKSSEMSACVQGYLAASGRLPGGDPPPRCPRAHQSGDRRASRLLTGDSQDPRTPRASSVA